MSLVCAGAALGVITTNDHGKGVFNRVRLARRFNLELPALGFENLCHGRSCDDAQRLHLRNTSDIVPYAPRCARVSDTNSSSA